jgi:hypothetical protein
MAWNYFITGQESEFHQTARNALRQVQPIQDAALARPEIGEGFLSRGHNIGPF